MTKPHLHFVPAGGSGYDECWISSRYTVGFIQPDGGISIRDWTKRLAEPWVWEVAKNPKGMMYKMPPIKSKT